jgi:hypothetical protein
MRVTLDLFSGRPHSSWEISSWHARELEARVADKRLSPVRMERPRLGFRGLIVASQSDDARRRVPATFRLGAPVSAETMAPAEREVATLAEPETRQVAHWLLQSGVGSIDSGLLAYASARLQAQPPADASPAREMTIAASATIPPCVSSSPYDPDFWSDPSVEPFNNCYNFATNFRSGTTAQPGRISGAHYSEFSCWNVGVAASYDGVGTTCAFVSNLVALVIWPGVDFHWYRLQAEGFWAHKIGHGPATNLESGGHVIQGEWTPANCGRGPYSLFCGYRYAPLGIHVM